MTTENLSKKTLTEWIENYTDNTDLPFVTKSVRLSKDDLTWLVKTLENVGGDGIRMYFIRFKKNDSNYPKYTTAPKSDEHMTFVGRGLTQVSIAIVPTKNYEEAKMTWIGSSEDVINKDETLAVFVPGGGENSGLCPPNCQL